MTLHPIRKSLRQFRTDEHGVMTVFGIFLLLITLIIGGLALDVANAMRARTHLQVAADSAAHAALMLSQEMTSQTAAKLAAVEIARGSMPTSTFGNVIRVDDITFGVWDETTRQFTATPGTNAAVRVDAAQIEERLNSVGTYFLKFAGFDQWNIVRQSVFETYIPTCFREGFVAQGEVDVTTGNLYKAGFCIHSNSYVELNNGNVFEPGVIVSMPDKRSVVMPSDGFTNNVGFRASLRDGSYALQIQRRVDEYILGVQTPGSPHYRDYITSVVPVPILPSQKFDASLWQPGRIHYLTCTSSGQKARVHAGTTLQSGVLVTNCILQFGENVALEDVTVVNTNTAVDSLNASSGLRLGRDDDCAAGGGAQLVTRGGVKIPQYFQMYGSQVIAVGDVSFTSDAQGVEGASIISGGRISGTTDSVIGFCDGAGLENNFVERYGRMVL